MIAFVLAFSMYFYVANRRQTKGKKLIEGTVRECRSPWYSFVLTVVNRRVSAIHTSITYKN